MDFFFFIFIKGLEIFWIFLVFICFISSKMAPKRKKKGSNEGSSSGKKVMDFRKVSSLIPDARKERYKEFFHEI
jgi:hypothetical protein